MTTLLIIDHHPELRHYIREATPSDWRVLEAADGLTGLDMVRQYLPQLDLIVLAMDLPDLDGQAVCMSIRATSATIPILPLTETARSMPLLIELACLPALMKPVQFSTLRQTLQTALHQPQRPVTSSAVLFWAQEQSSKLEQYARHSRRIIRVAVFASSQIKRVGMARMLELTTEPCEATTLAALQALLAKGQCTAIISDAADHADVCPLARMYGLPLILIAATLEQSRALHTADVTVVVLDSDRTVAARLAIAIEAIANGEPYKALPIELGPAASSGRILPSLLAQRFTDTPLSPREQEVLWLDYQGLSTAQIALYLKINPQTVGSHWKGAQRKVQMRRSALRAWVRTLLSNEDIRSLDRSTDKQLGP